MSATAQTTRRPTARSRNGGLALDELLVLAALALLLCAVLLPLLVVALPLALVFLVGMRRGWWPAWLPVLVGVLTGASWALWLRAHGGWEPAVQAYASIQTDMANALLWEHRLLTWDALAIYAADVWPYAVPGGVVLGTIIFVLFGLLRFPTAAEQNKTKPLALREADALATLPVATDAEHVAGLVARHRLTAITALPKRGKTVAYFGLLRARQDGGTWFGRRCRPGRTCVLTEEDAETFAAKVRQFGIRSDTLVSIHAPDTDLARFRQDAWEAFVFEAAGRAAKAKCDTLDVDTLTTWAPWTIGSADAMSFCLRTLKAAVVRYHLAGVVILHNRKSGGDSPVVAALGTIAGPAAYDVIASFDREKASGVCTLTVEGRLGEWEQTARLEGTRYVPIAAAGSPSAASDEAQKQEPAAPAPAAPAPAPPPVTAHLQTTLDAVAAAGVFGAETLAVQQATGAAMSTVTARLRALRDAGAITSTGAGGKGDPLRWFAADAAPPQSAPPAPTADPAYVRYLGSKEWRERCAPVLERAGGRCEDCGAPPAAGDTLEVHHLHYGTLYAERPEDLAALCSGCHRRRHAK